MKRTRRAAEGFTIRANEEGVWVDGNDERGVMFGTGRLLREMRMTHGKVTLEDGFFDHDHTEVSIAWTPAWVSTEDAFLRRLGFESVGAVLSRLDCVRRERSRADSAAFG